MSLNSNFPVDAMPHAYTDLQGLQRLRNMPDKDQALKQVAQQFESMFLNVLMKNMRQANAVFEEGSLFNSSESHMIRDMYDQQLSLNMAHAGGTGLAEALYRQMSGQYGLAPEGGKPADTHDWRLGRTAAAPVVSSADVRSGSEGAVAQMEEVVGIRAERAPLTDSPADFIKTLAPYAREAAQKLGLDSNLLLAQAALETGWGQQVLADQAGSSSHNLFNIKAGDDWRGDSVAVRSLEYRDGIAVQEESRFRQYASAAESFEDFVQFVQGRERYAEAVRSAGDPEGFIRELHRAGYATDPDYSDKVLSVYRELTADQVQQMAAQRQRAALAGASPVDRG